MAVEEKTIFDAMPGELMSVSSVTATLSKMWQAPVAENVDVSTEFRASQMNLVIHFGLQTTQEEALETFDTAIEFAQRYPCRLIVLCPRGREVSDKLLEGKLFSQCYIGDSIRSMCCCEALMLGYPTRVADFLDNQVSIWLENDLPTCHWFYKVPAKRVQEIHMSFIKRCRRVLFDSSIEELDYQDIEWNRSESVIDLAYARLLPVRQALGQFISSYPIATILDGLKTVQVRYAEGCVGEAVNLMKWHRCCLADCAERTGQSLKINFERAEGTSKSKCLEVEWKYEGGKKQFTWSFDRKKKHASIIANLGGEKLKVPMAMDLLSPEKALSEAVFFG